MRNKTRLDMLGDIGVISRVVSRRVTGKWVPRGHFSLHRFLTVARIRVDLTVGIHIAPPGAGYPTYRANVGLHAPTRRGAESGWHPTLLRLGWYRLCEEFLARYRYRGDWIVTPYGRLGDFERRVTTRTALLAELDVLESLYAAAWPLTRPK